MNKASIINKTVNTLQQLPSEKIVEVADFAEYMLKKHEDHLLRAGIEKLVETGKSYDFLNTEEELYSVNDVIEKYK